MQLRCAENVLGIQSAVSCSVPGHKGSYGGGLVFLVIFITPARISANLGSIHRELLSHPLPTLVPVKAPWKHGFLFLTFLSGLTSPRLFLSAHIPFTPGKPTGASLEIQRISLLSLPVPFFSSCGILLAQLSCPEAS